MSEMSKDMKDNGKMKDIFKNFTKREFISSNALIEGLYIGKTNVKSALRNDAMSDWFDGVCSKIMHAQDIIVKKANIDSTHHDALPKELLSDIEYLINAIVYFIEMNQDIYTQQILDGLNKLVDDAIDEKINYDPNKDIKYYIPNIDEMNLLTQEIVKQLLGELLAMLVVGR